MVACQISSTPGITHSFFSTIKLGSSASAVSHRFGQGAETRHIEQGTLFCDIIIGFSLCADNFPR
jgi:hypothetical protein